MYNLGLKVRPFRETCRPKQLPWYDPDHKKPDRNGFRCMDKRCVLGVTDTDSNIGLFLGGRGTGKTWAGANFILENAMRYPRTRWAVVGTTSDDLERVCFREESGLLGQALPGEITDYNINKKRIIFANGSEVHGFSADSYERVRGSNLAGMWFDEFAIARYGLELWNALRPAIRKEPGRIYVTSTPRNCPLLKKLLNNPMVHVTNGKMTENEFLAPGAVQDLLGEFHGTRLARQELDGEYVDLEGMLFLSAWLEDNRVTEVPALTRIVIGVDPAMTSHETSDESGIIVVGQSEDAVYVLDDFSLRGTPREVALKIRFAAERWHADCVVVEVNQGAEWVTSTIHHEAPNLRIRKVHSRQGKVTRAEPVALIAERGDLHMVGVFAQLEEQLLMMSPGEKLNGLCDRADAMIHAVFELRDLSGGSYLGAYGFTKCPRCGGMIREDAGECPCGEVQPVREKPAADPRSWAHAYGKRCQSCDGFYPERLAACPKCFTDPLAFLAQVQAFTGQGQPLRTRGLNSFWRKGY